MNKQVIRRRRVPALSLLSLALAGALAMPAFAADPPCPDGDADTSQGIEDSEGATGENTTCHPTASAYGYGNIAGGSGSSAFGQSNTASGGSSSAFGFYNEAEGVDSSAVGSGNWAGGAGSSAMGWGNFAAGVRSSAFGYSNIATGDRSSAFGYWGNASGAHSTVLSGWWDRDEDGVVDANEVARANGISSIALGAGVLAARDYGTAVGVGTEAAGERSTAVGMLSVANGMLSGAFGYNNAANGDAATAIGVRNVSSGSYSSAFGYNSQALNIGSTAIGYQAIADRNYAIAVGRAGGEHQVIHMADGTEDYDAVNVRQLRALVNWFGGGAAFTSGVFTAPTFTIQGLSYNSVGAAFAAVDSQLSLLAGSVGGPPGPQGEPGPTGPAGPQGEPGPAGVMDTAYVDAGDAATLEAAEQYADAGDAATLASANAHADAGDAATLTSSKTYTDSKSSQALASANAYTDSKFAAWNDTFTKYQQQVDRRFAQTDMRIDQIGAMGSAMTHMAVNAANGNSPKGRIAIGVGAQGSQGAVSIGYGKRVGDRGSFSLGASFAGGESSAGAGFGFDL